LERSSTCKRYKENDGFVTTTKKIIGRNQKIHYWHAKENGVAKRKASTEATNFQQSNVTEITGKWQFPHKRKPDRGPTLKQLRLERWVHKVGKISPQ